MFNRLHILPLATLLICGLATIATWASKENDWEKDARSRKAEYMYLEAQSAYNDGAIDLYLSLIDRAYELDSADVDIAGEWGLMALINENFDSLKAEKAYRLVKRRFMSNPRNLINGRIFANVAQQEGRFKDAVRTWQILDSIYPTNAEPSLELAKAYLRTFLTGDSASFDKAIAIYERMETGTGKNVDLSNQKINAYYLKGDTAAVVRELDSLYASAPHDSYTALFVGLHYQYMSKNDEALKYFNISCDLDSANGPAYLQRAQFYSQQGDSIGFDREVFQALKSQSLDVNTKLEILRSYVADLYTDPRQEARIKELFNTLQQQHSGEPEIHDLYASYLYALEDYKGSAEQFSYSVALDPSKDQSWTSYVQTLALANDSITAINVARQARERFPDNLYYPIVISTIYSMNGDTRAAMATLDSIDINGVANPEMASEIIMRMADLTAMEGDTIAALSLYDKAIERNPDNKMAMNNAAYFMAVRNIDLDKAERYSSMSLKGDELNPTYLDTYAWVLFKKKDYKLAKYYIDLALKYYYGEEDENPEVDTGEAEVDTPADADADSQESAIEEVVVEAEEASAEILDHAGDIYFMNGEHEKALEFWDKAHILDPDDKLIEKKVKNRTIFMR